MTFTFNSFIDGGTFDGPGGTAPGGDKLTSYIYVTTTQDEVGNLLSAVVTSDYTIGKTFGIFRGRDYFPGLGEDQNKALSLSGLSFSGIFEQHASVPGFEGVGLNMMGYDIVNVAQKVNISLHGGYLNVSAYTDVFPSATFDVNGHQLFRYDQPSFKGTHGKIGGHGAKRFRPAPSFYKRY